MKPGRNDLCPCGSGAKYKKCCMPAETGMRPLHALDHRLRQAVMDYANAKFDRTIYADAQDQPVAEDVVPLFVAWMLFHHAVEGRSVAGWYLEEHGAALEADEREWLSAQARTRLSVWKVLDVRPGRDVAVEDLLTGECCNVQDVAASRSLRPLQALLGRVTSFQGARVFAGAHPYLLTPVQVADVLRALGPVEPAALVLGPTTLRLLRLWDARVQAELARPRGALTNSAGDTLAPQALRFRYQPSGTEALVEALLQVEGMRAERIADDLLLWSEVTEAGMGTVVAALVLKDGTLEVQVNSDGRAALCRARVPSLATYTETVPLDMGTYTATLHRVAPAQRPDPEALRRFKAQHYQGWLDQPLPALHGETPRQAATTAEGRARLSVLIEEMEYRETQEPRPLRYDLTGLRVELGL